jgi:DNA invertase Pin-like site-specific DNA recombinase
MASILAWVAAYEAEVRAERILAGETASPMRGVRWGKSARGLVEAKSSSNDSSPPGT